MSDELQATASASRGFVLEGRVVDAGRAIEWLKEGWQLFLKNPGIWIGITVALFVVGFVLSLIPLVGQLVLNLLTPVLGGGLLLGCRSLRDGNDIRFDHLVAGFKHNTGNLIMVGVYYTVGMALIMIITFLIGGGAALTGAITGNGIGAGIIAGGFLLAMLVMLVLMLPLIMAVWFAPALVTFHNVEPIAAMKASFAVSLKNMVPFLVYGIVVMVLAFVASVPLFLGWLVLIPMLVGAHYISYLDIFE